MKNLFSTVAFIVVLAFFNHANSQVFNFGVGKVYHPLNAMSYDNATDVDLTLLEIYGNAGRFNLGAQIRFGEQTLDYLPLANQVGEVLQFGYVGSYRIPILRNSFPFDLEIGGQFNLNATHGYLESMDFGLHYTLRKYFDTRIGVFVTSRTRLWERSRQIINSNYTSTFGYSQDLVSFGIFYKFPSFEPIPEYEAPKKNQKPRGIIY